MTTKKRVSANYNQETLNISKCKRIIRPLLSKIHGLHNLNSKYPSLMEFNYPYDHQQIRNINIKKKNVTYSSSRPSSREDQCTSKRVKLSKTFNKDSRDDSDLDLAYELTFIMPSSPNDRNMEEKYNELKLNRFINPVNSLERLHGLKSLLSKELYENYVEIFQIFKNIITAIIINGSPRKEFSEMPRLSSICAFKLGKSITLSTKTTYHKLSNSLLFESDSMSKDLQRYHQLLNNDIDDWLEMEPELLSATYRKDFLIGYIIHLLVFNSNSLFYYLIPVLVQWLHEESNNLGNLKLKEVSRTLFNEYWNFGDSYFEEIDPQLILHPNHSFNTSQNLKAFWIFYIIGYWENFIESIGLKSNVNNYSDFECLMLDTLPLNNKLNLHILSSIQTTFDNSEIFKDNIYQLIKNNSQHPQINNILISMITQIILNIRSHLRSLKTSSEVIKHFNRSCYSIVEFLSIWLSFTNEREAVFNSLYPGNDIIFQAISKICNFMLIKCNNFIKKLENLMEESGDGASFSYTKDEFQFQNQRIRMLYETISLLELYFLDTAKPTRNNYINPSEVSEIIIDLQRCNHINKNKSNMEFNDFLLWLNDVDNESYKSLARQCFQKYYGYTRRFRNENIDYIHQSLFKNDILSDF